MSIFAPVGTSLRNRGISTTRRCAPAQDLRSDWPRPSSGAVRRSHIELIKRQIADGTYDTPERLDEALNRMLDSVGAALGGRLEGQ